MLRSDPDPVVDDVQPGDAIADQADVHRHVATRWRVTNRVLDQVGDELMERIAMPNDQRRVGVTDPYVVVRGHLT